MQIADILPLIVPGIILQLVVQAYYISHCWRNPRLTQRQKAGYIISIAVFNIIGAAAYLLLTRKKDAGMAANVQNAEIDNQTRQGVFVLLLVAFEVFSLRIIAQNTGSQNYSLTITLLAACFVMLIAGGLFVRRRHAALYYSLPVLQIITVVAVAYLDRSQSMEFVVLAVVAHIINNYSLKESKAYALVSFILYIAVAFIKVLVRYGTIQSDEFVSYFYVNMIVFLLVFLAFYTLKKQLLANARLQDVLGTLKQQSLRLEEMGAVAERNRIAGEIHDTVGHTLTTAVISIEAGQKLMEADPIAAREKFALAGEQIKQGLSDIRGSVKMIQTGGEEAFEPALLRLLEDIRQNTDMKVTLIVELKTELLPIQQSILLRAVKECATNSLKHGGSTEADVLVQQYKDTVRLTFSDNGRGTSQIRYGFGLSTMAQRVQSIGGTLYADSSPGEGFSVNIAIPVKEGGIV